jgi:hypothetical protein
MFVKTLIIVVMLALLPACGIRTSKQNPDKAATSAVGFAKVALVDRDMDKAYQLLDAEAQSNVPKEKFVEILLDMNSDSLVRVVTATEFEAIPGQDAMNIYLVGENGRDKFHYRIPMKGSDTDGYKPFGIMRGQYQPSASRQPLSVKRSTDD